MTSTQYATQSFSLAPADAQQIALLCGPLNSHLKLIESCLEVDLELQGDKCLITGEPAACERAKKVIEHLYKKAGNGEPLQPKDIQLLITSIDYVDSEPKEIVKIKSLHGLIRPRSPHQQNYLDALQKYDVNFGIGPAGTGKTFLAVAAAVHAWRQEQVDRIVLVRPAVEAGERLGFLPGDLSQKVDPYLRPLYDGLYEMLGAEKVNRMIEKNVIEIAPLAYMRGRTLNNAFILLDESQNTTREQMKMFLTRIGFGAKAAITGDITQVDLPRKEYSGLQHAMDVLKNIDGIQFSYFDSTDVVRHPLVQKIIEAYEES